MILTVTPNPCVDKTVFIEELKPGTFMRSQKCTCIPGGKGTNVSRAVKQMGCDTKAMVVVGGHPGRHVVEMIQQQDGIACVPAWVASQTRTITTVLEEPIHRQTAFFEPGSRVTEEEGRGIVETFQHAVNAARVVTFNGTVSDQSISWLYGKLIPIAKQSGTITILDSHGPEFARGIESNPYMVKPNIAELQELVGFSIENVADQLRAIEAVHERGIALVVLSLGKDGAIVSRGDERFHVKPPEIQEVNAVGSGDALVAGFAIGLMEDQPLQEIAHTACAMGTANAMSWDIGHFTREEVEQVREQVTVTPL
ncbi:MAG: 1-phosphofructokinase family hexose kinase [Candidatus Hydrogenedentes bacterium]|nr:1-phosphofructokinase family hexose kinase [Candidatus Hydrogenedentota bacterium]